MTTTRKTKAFYVTTPIYYVNDIPHIGHAYTGIAADVLARFKRLDGYQVHFLTGTDEHGQKVEKAAAAAGEDPKDFVNRVSQHFQDLAKKLQLSNDIFMRTTRESHYKSAQDLWMKLVDAGYIYKGSYAGWYAVRDEAFYQESELIDGKAPTGAPVEWVEESSYFFKLSAFQDKLLKFYADHPQAVAPESRFNEVIRFIQGGLKDLSISRSTFKWGVPVPNDPDHIMYVWIDALTNYITALGYPDRSSSDMETFWPESLHLIGKDILRFHCVYWHAFLMAAGLNPPKRVFAHGWWTNEGQKISKSSGNVIDPYELIDTYGVDGIRYFLIREIPFGGDGDFSKRALIARINSDLANDFGNLVQRVLSFVYKNCEAKVPTPDALKPEDTAFLEKAHALLETLRQHADVQALHKMCESIWEVISYANRYVDQEQPWALRKTDTARMETVLYVLTEVIRHLAILAQPIIPIASGKVLDQLNIPADARLFDCLESTPLKSGTTLNQPEGVFPRIQSVSL